MGEGEKKSLKLFIVEYFSVGKYFIFLCVRSCNMKLNLDYLLEMVWEHLALLRIYTKKRGGEIDDSLICFDEG